MKEKTLGIIWMSAGNSYFREEVIEKLIESSLKKFEKIAIMSPDEPAEHTYRSLGYKEGKARRKARLNANLLQNRARRIKEELSLENQRRIKIVEWVDEISSNEEYRQEYKKIIELYKDNIEFMNDADSTTKEVLEGKFESIPEESIKEAVHYLLKELAFVLASPKIFETKTSTYIYHKSWPIFQNLIEGKYDGKNRPELNFLLQK